MLAQIRHNRTSSSFSQTAGWRGRSGQYYGLISERVDKFSLAAGELHLLAKGHMVLWVGSASDLIEDAMSRTRFKLALDCADRAFRVETPKGEAAHMATIWDLEGAEPVEAIAA